VKFDTNHYCVYAHYLNGELMYIGAGSFQRAFSVTSRSPKYLQTFFEKYPTIEFWYISKNRRDVLKIESAWIKILNPPLNQNSLDREIMKDRLSQKKGRVRNQGVLCVETGIVFESIQHVAAAMKLNPSTLSNHLNGRIGYRHVRGWTFERSGKFKPNHAPGMDVLKARPGFRPGD